MQKLLEINCGHTIEDKRAFIQETCRIVLEQVIDEDNMTFHRPFLFFGIRDNKIVYKINPEIENLFFKDQNFADLNNHYIQDDDETNIDNER